MKTHLQDKSRFAQDASRYAAYLETPGGRLRTDLAFANLQEFLPPPTEGVPLRVLDLGGGTGGAAIRLARLGMQVTLLDSSAAMLKLAERSIAAAGASAQITIQSGDATQLAHIVPARSCDLVLCHNLLEYVDDPCAVLRGAAHAMRNSSATVSILVRNQAGEVLKAALQSGDLAAAEDNLSADWGHESLYGGQVRLFTPETLAALLKSASLTGKAQRAVRALSDYLPSQIARSSEYDRIFALEHKLARRPEFYGVARYLQCFANCATLGPEAIA